MSGNPQTFGDRLCRRLGLQSSVRLAWTREQIDAAIAIAKITQPECGEFEFKELDSLAVPAARRLLRLFPDSLARGAAIMLCRFVISCLDGKHERPMDEAEFIAAMLDMAERQVYMARSEGPPAS